MTPLSLRYGNQAHSDEPNDLRTQLLKLVARIQGKHVKIVDSDPKLVSEILMNSDTKGSFIETLIATPAWFPILSTESVDGELWKDLSGKFHELSQKLDWKTRLPFLQKKYFLQLKLQLENQPHLEVTSQEVSRLTLRVFYELVFSHEISKEDEELFFRASLEWRKEIAIKGKANPQIKLLFWNRLKEITSQSPLLTPNPSPESLSLWTSAIAQPLIISPQINVSDIMVACFQFLRKEKKEGVQYLEVTKNWATSKDLPRLTGVILETIRLQHPFPVLEREISKGTTLQGRIIQEKTQVFILLDQFKQDQAWNPERWLRSSKENPYFHIPFGAGRRVCAGKPIALELLTSMLSTFLVDLDTTRIKPEKDHLYSGRINDRSTSLWETLYQIKVFSKVLLRSLLLRCRFINKIDTKEALNSAPFNRCPFSYQSHASSAKTEAK